MKLRSKTKISKSKEINNLHTNVIQTRSKKIKTDHCNNLHINVIRTRSKRTKTDNAKNLLEPNCVKSQMTISFQYLPDLVLESIFKFLTFHEIAGLRILCRRFNEVCKREINRGYRIVHQNVSELIQKVNGSEDLRFLNEINARLSMFDLAFYYHINAKRCCFFPGEVLDVIGDYIYWMKDKFNTNLCENCVTKILEKLKNIELVCHKALDYAVTSIFPTFNISMESTSVVLSSSTPFIFHEHVLKSALGILKPSDFRYYKSMAKFKDEGREYGISAMKNSLKNIKIKYDNPIRGMDRRLVLEKALGRMFFYNESVICLMHWKGEKEAEFVKIV